MSQKPIPSPDPILLKHARRTAWLWGLVAGLAFCMVGVLMLVVWGFWYF